MGHRKLARIAPGAALVMAGFSALLAGCATRPAPPDKFPLAQLPGSPACIWGINLDDWQALDDSTLLVHAPLPSDAYVVKLFAPDPQLPFRERLGFQDADDNGQICSIGDYLIIGGPMRERLPITAVRKLTTQQAQALRERAGLATAAPKHNPDSHPGARAPSTPPPDSQPAPLPPPPPPPG